MLRTHARSCRLAAWAGLLAALPAAAVFAQGKTMAQDDWVETSAIDWSGGVRVAAGAAATAGDEHEVEYSVEAGAAPPPRGAGDLAAPAKRGTAKEMDHASPKLAQFAINGNSLAPCTVGTRYPQLRLRDGGKRWRLDGVAVVGCGDGRMTVSYRHRAAVR